MYRETRFWNRSIQSSGRWLIHIPWTFISRFFAEPPPVATATVSWSVLGDLNLPNWSPARSRGLIHELGAVRMAPAGPGSLPPHTRTRRRRSYLHTRSSYLASCLYSHRAKRSWRLNRSPYSDNDGDVLRRSIRITPLIASRLVNPPMGQFIYFSPCFMWSLSQLHRTFLST